MKMCGIYLGNVHVVTVWVNWRILQVPSRVTHLIAHVVLVTLTHCLGDVLEVTHDVTPKLEEAMFGFVPHTPQPRKWTTPTQ